MDETIRVPLDPETAARLRSRALAERRATSDEAAIILTRALARQARQQAPGDAPRDAGQ